MYKSLLLVCAIYSIICLPPQLEPKPKEWFTRNWYITGPGLIKLMLWRNKINIRDIFATQLAKASIFSQLHTICTTDTRSLIRTAIPDEKSGLYQEAYITDAYLRFTSIESETNFTTNHSHIVGCIVSIRKHTMEISSLHAFNKDSATPILYNLQDFMHNGLPLTMADLESYIAKVDLLERIHAMQNELDQVTLEN